MKEGVRQKNFPQKKYMFSEVKKYSFRWIFGSSHFIMAFFAAVGAFVSCVFLGSFFGNELFFSLVIYLIVQLALAFDYYLDRHIDEKFLLFFYFFSVLSLAIFFIFGLY